MGRAKALADLGLEEKGKASVNLERWPGGFLAAETLQLPALAANLQQHRPKVGRSLQL
jgi:hypothetical protein